MNNKNYASTSSVLHKSTAEIIVEIRAMIKEKLQNK